MIGLGDIVREVGGDQDFLVDSYGTANGKFMIRSLKGPIQIKSVDEKSLELVKKAHGSDLGGPSLMPERWITD